MSNMRVENWRGYDIRFVDIDGEWWAILKDICDALGLKTFDVSRRLHPDMMERVLVETFVMGSNHVKYDNPLRVVRSKADSNDVRSDLTSFEMTSNTRGRGDRKSMWMLAVNEAGIYQALFASRKLEARKFQLWTFDVLKKLRSHVGLQQYEVMRMTEPDIQDQIDWILDSLYWDEERKCVMQSVTVQGGDVEQIPFEG